MKKLFSFFLFLAIGAVCFAQNENETPSWQPSLSLNVSGVPTMKISGVDTSFASSLSIAPAFTIRSKNGWGASYAPFFMVGGSHSGLFLHAVTVGYEQYDKENFDLVANYTHSFFTGNSSIPYTPINNEIFSHFAYKRSVIRPVISAGFGFGQDKRAIPAQAAYDIGVAAGIAHAFDWEGKTGSFSLIPALLLNAGTNQYFSFMSITKYIAHSSGFTSYVKKGTGSSGSTRGRTRGGSSSGSSSSGSTTNSTTTQNVSVADKESFSLSNAELNLESELEFGHLALRPAASLFVPVGSAAGAGAFGYWNFTLQYNFK